MSFVKSAEQIARIQDALHNPRFVDAEMLTVDFLTEPSWVAHVLPPPLEPASQPRVTAMVGRWRSNCVGDFAGGAVYVEARFGDLVGDYVLSMWMDGDQATIYGRDVFGEPKKLAASWLHRSGNSMSGRIERHGVTLVELTAELSQDNGPGQSSGVNFNVKARPAADGIGLEEDAILTVAEFRNQVRVSRQGTGTVTLRGTVHDPLDEIVVRQVLRAGYMEGDLHAQARSAARIPAAGFVPYHYGRMDDWSALSTEGTPRVLASSGCRGRHPHAGLGARSRTKESDKM
jgi:acetoacetate decarboxylase